MVQLSPTALDEVNRLKSKPSYCTAAVLRVAVHEGGCSGWSYQMSFEAAAQVSDQVFDCGNIQVVVDPQSWPYLRGLTLDYTEDLMGGSFRFNNPNARQTCSCGHSFGF
jgi:iron-sulfur cluster assembly protein